MIYHTITSNTKLSVKYYGLRTAYVWIDYQMKQRKSIGTKKSTSQSICRVCSDGGTASVIQGLARLWIAQGRN